MPFVSWSGLKHNLALKVTNVNLKMSKNPPNNLITPPTKWGFAAVFQSVFLLNAAEYSLMESVTLLEPSRAAGELADMSAGPGRSRQTDLINQPSATGQSDKMAGGSVGAEMAI